MKMITEDYVSFETAKLLKEKGFKERVKSYYTESGLEGYMLALKTTKNTELDNRFISRPTLQMAMKYLREVHHLHLSIDSYPHEDNCFYWCYKVLFMDESNLCSIKKHAKAGFDSFEAAVEAAIKYCLENLI